MLHVWILDENEIFIWSSLVLFFSGLGTGPVLDWVRQTLTISPSVLNMLRDSKTERDWWMEKWVRREEITSTKVSRDDETSTRRRTTTWHWSWEINKFFDWWFSFSSDTFLLMPGFIRLSAHGYISSLLFPIWFPPARDAVVSYIFHFAICVVEWEKRVRKSLLTFGPVVYVAGVVLGV